MEVYLEMRKNFDNSLDIWAEGSENVIFDDMNTQQAKSAVM